MNMLVNILVVTAFYVTAFFLATYWLLAPWWRREAGRNIFSFMGCVNGLALTWCLRLLFGAGYWGQSALFVFFLAGAIGVTAWRWVMLVRAQLGRRGSAPEPHDESHIG